MRIKFINEIIKIKYKNEKEKNFINNTLYNIILLTIILQQFLKENSMLKNNNDLQQGLLKYSIEILNYQYLNIANLKLIIFYLANLFIYLFNGMNDINNYFQIENTYIKKIQMIMDNKRENTIIEDNEIYSFLKINLISLGNLFTTNNINFSITNETQLVLLNYYIRLLHELYPEIVNNYEIIKKKVTNQIENFLFTHSNTNSSNSISTNKNNNHIKNNKNNLYTDFQQIIDSLYNFLTFIISDISYGSNLFEIMDRNIKSFMNDNEQINRFNEVILIHLYEKCIEKDFSKFFIMTLIIYIQNKFYEDIKGNSQFYSDIFIKFYQLIMNDDILNERCTKIFAKIFIKEINIIENNKSLISYLNPILKEKNDPKKIIVPLITNISFLFKEQNLKNKLEIYKRCSLLLEKYSKEDMFNNTEKKETIDYENIKIIIINFNTYNNSINELNTKNQLLIINYFEFFLYLITFTESNFINSEIKTNQSFKTKFLYDIFSFIYQLEIYSIDSTEYLLLIIRFIKLLFYCFENNYISNLHDTCLIYKIMGQKYKKLLKIEYNDKNLSYLPYLSYYILIFILIRLNQIFKYPNSFQTINNNIIEGINKINNDYYRIFKEISIDNYQKTINNNLELFLKIFYQDLKTNFNYIYKIQMNLNTFKRIIDIIYTQIFGYSSIINSFFDSQLKNLNISEGEIDKTSPIHNSNRTETITEGREINYDISIKDDSISMKFSDESIMKENSIEDISNDQLINVHLKNSLKIINNNNLNDVIQPDGDNLKI